MSRGRLLIYVLRRDLRISDNPIFHHLATTSDHGFTHFLPVFNFPSHQIEVTGFLKSGETSPFPPAVSKVGGFWRTGPHRAEFLAQSVWNLKENLEKLDAGLCLRVGKTSDVVKGMIEHFKDKGPSVAAVWMTEEPSHEEVQEQNAIAKVCSDNQVDFKLWNDEKYFIDDRDTKLKDPADLPDVFTSYRKTQEPLREKPRPALPRPTKSSLPLFPTDDVMPSQQHPFVMAETLDDLVIRLQKPLISVIHKPPFLPEGPVSAHTFSGGESAAQDRLHHLINSGSMTTYKDTRNGLLGLDYSTKLGGYLSLGCLTARQVHEEMLKLEDGSDSQYSEAKGYGQGENNGTAAVRFELLWRDYMRLSTKKFGVKLFQVGGFRQSQEDRDDYKAWLTAEHDQAEEGQDPSPDQAAGILNRFFEGTTGMGLIDASQRELYHTGYTSNRARQNVASFLSKHLGIDWRYGAEWYEMMLIDYDVSSNWANWQYLAGVGNDPRSDDRIFNPVKQAFDYDKDGSYVRTWVPELRGLKKLQHLFQPCTASKDELIEAGITEEHIMYTQPLKRIPFEINFKAKNHRGGRNWQGSTSRRGGRRGNRSFGSECNGEHNTHQVNGQNSNTHKLQDDHSEDPPPYSSLPYIPHSVPPKEGPGQTGAGNPGRNLNGDSGYQPSFTSNVNVHIDPTTGQFPNHHVPHQHVPGMQSAGGFGYQNFHPQGYIQPQIYQPHTYQIQVYQPQAYQPNSFQPQAHQIQTYQPQGYQPPPPPVNGHNGFFPGSFPSFGFPGDTYQGYRPPTYPAFNSQGNPTQGYQENGPPRHHGYQGGNHHTGGWSGFGRQGGRGGRAGWGARAGWGHSNGGPPSQSQVQSFPETLAISTTPQQQPSILSSENGELPVMSALPRPDLNNTLFGDSENHEISNSMPQESEAQPSVNSTGSLE